MALTLTSNTAHVHSTAQRSATQHIAAEKTRLSSKLGPYSHDAARHITTLPSACL